jgi:23S rRNA (guanosine2251-2'-O)-methyltransferase
MSTERLQGRNPVIEALQRRRRAVRLIRLDEGAQPDPKLDRLLALAREQKVPVERVSRRLLDRLAGGDVHNGVVADAEPLPQHSVSSLLDELEGATDPFLVMVDELSYEHNLGAILRSCLGAGVNGLITPVRRTVSMSPVVARVSMGAVEEVPVVHEGLSSALKVDLTGPLLILLGGESKGLTDPLRKRCDEIVSVPLLGGLESLNVSVTAGVLLFERTRQQAVAARAAQG